MLGLGSSLTGGFLGGGPPFSLWLSGSDDYARIDNNVSLKPTSAITVSTWVNLDAQYGGSGWTYVNPGGSNDHHEYIVGTVASGGYGLNVFYGGTEANPIVRISAQVYVADTGNGNPGYLEAIWGGIVTSTGSSALHEIKDLSGWVHLAMTYDGGVLRLYINGNNDLNDGAVDTSDDQVVDTSLTGVAIVYTVATKVMIGGDAIGTGSSAHQLTISGLIDEVAIWSTALDEDGIEEIYNNGAATLDLTSSFGDYDNHASLQGYWKFEEGTGTTVTDSSSNSNTATLVNNPAWSDNTAT